MQSGKKVVCRYGYIMWILRNYAPQSLTEEILR